MARETKVGLLAGLAFIICFAVILANHGRRLSQEPQTSPSRFQYVQSPETSPVPVHGAPARVADAPRRIERKPPNDNLTALTDRGHQADRDAEERFRDLERRLDQVSRQLASKEGNEFRLTASPVSDGEGDQDTGDEAAPPITQNAPTESSATAPQPEPPVTVQVLEHYKVVAGDTLSRIANEHYGTRSKRVIDAIMDANRGVLTNPDILTVGMELEMPKVDGVQQASPGPTRQGRQPEDARDRREPSAGENRSVPFRWYQIRKEDRYVTIARRELGDETRWREIFEMNKEVFPDPSHIRAGVRIKLPTVAMAAGGEGRRP